MMFSLHEKVVYPGHGVAQISRIVEKKVAGSSKKFFELKFLNKDMTILVPTDNLDAAGLRPLSSTKNITHIFKLLSEPVEKPTCDFTASNWNRRNKDYQFKLRSGNLDEICAIYKDLKAIAKQKELSYGEKNLLKQTEELLAEEISIVNKVNEEQAIEEIRSCFAHIDTSASLVQKM